MNSVSLPIPNPSPSPPNSSRLGPPQPGELPSPSPSRTLPHPHPTPADSVHTQPGELPFSTPSPSPSQPLPNPHPTPAAIENSPRSAAPSPLTSEGAMARRGGRPLTGPSEPLPRPSEPSQPQPGPSFISVSLMDVMEAVRLTQLKIDKLTEDFDQVRRLVQSLQHQESRGSVHPRTRHAPAETDEQPPSMPPSTDEPAQRHQTSTSPTSEQHDGRRHTVKQSLLVIGDSNVRRLEAASNQSERCPTFHSISGATTEHVKRDLSQAVSKCGASGVVINVGTNDITRKGSEVVVKDILSLAEDTKRKDGVQHVYICSVTPRKDSGSFIFSRSESVNNRLCSLCSKSSGISFIDLRQKLDRCQCNGIQRDGVHYNRAGATQILRAISVSAGDFLV